MNFPVSFSDTNYSITSALITSRQDAAARNMFHMYGKTTSSIQVYVNTTAPDGVDWNAIGY